MKKRFLLLALLAASVLGGCAAFYERINETTMPAIKVGKNSKGEPTFIVMPYVLYFKDRGSVTIVWRVDPRDGLRFPDDKGEDNGGGKGIFIDGEIPTAAEKQPERAAKAISPSSAAIRREQNQIVDCKRNGDYEYSCTNVHSRGGFFKYTIRLTDGRNTFVLDPVVYNW